MSVSPGTQPTHSGSVHSSNGSVLDVDIDATHQDPPLPQKRKGGRKPVSNGQAYVLVSLQLIVYLRYMPLPRNGNNVIDKHKLHSEKEEQNI